MQLDQTRITIRERSSLELYDLALRVLQGHGGAIGAYTLLGAVPLALFNVWLLQGRWQPPVEEWLQGDYYWHLALLMIWQYPLATAPLTIYLGKTLFLEHPSPAQVLRTLADRAGQLLLVHGLGRSVSFAGAIASYVGNAPPELIVIAGLWAVLGSGVCFFFWPYVNEVLLLEANPLRRTPGRSTTLKRVSSLHGYASGEVFMRSFLAIVIGSLLFVSLSFACFQLHTQATLASELSPEVQLFYFQLAGWCLVGFFAVVRFLSYLDLRIRIEGWELELLLKAEGARLSRQLT